MRRKQIFVFLSLHREKKFLSEKQYIGVSLTDTFLSIVAHLCTYCSLYPKSCSWYTTAADVPTVAGIPTVAFNPSVAGIPTVADLPTVVGIPNICGITDVAGVHGK